MNTWATQDLAMAKILKDYGFSGVYRASQQKLLASFDGGPFCYELPWLCFLFVQPSEIVDIDNLISDCEVTCR